MRETKNSGIEWIGEIPQNWELHRLQFSLNEKNAKNCPIQTSQVLSLVKDKGVMLYEEKGDLGNKSKEDVSEYKLAYPNTLIVNSMNILIGSVGISNYFGCISPVYYVFEETDRADLRFINYIFNTREFQKELRKYANGILEIRLRVSAYDIFKRKVALPSKSEQTRIADFLDSKCSEIDSLISDIQEQIDVLEQYKRSVITETVTKGLDPDVEMKDSGVEWIGEIPKDWAIIPFKYTHGESNVGESIDKDFWSNEESDITFYTAGLKPTHTTYPDFPKWKYTHPNDLLLARNGTPYVYLPSDHAMYSDHIIRVAISNKHDKRYIRYCLQQSIESVVVDVVSIATWSVGIWNGQKLPSPCPKEQTLIADYLDNQCSEIDACIIEKQKQISTLESYKKSLIYEYVTGKKEVNQNEVLLEKETRCHSSDAVLKSIVLH